MFGGGYNLLIVWMLTGFWHGAYWTFLLWGLGYYVMLMLEKHIVKPEGRSLPVRVIWRMVTLLTIIVLWIVFRADNLHVLCCYLKSLIHIAGSTFDNNFLFYLREYAVFFIICAVCSTPIIKSLVNKIQERCQMAYYIVSPIVLVALLTVSVSYQVMGYHNPFIYFNF